MQPREFNSLWCIQEKDYNVVNNKRYEGMLCQGNGYVSVRAYLEEGLLDFENHNESLREADNVTLEGASKSMVKYGTYLPGITGNHPNLNEEIVNLPYFFGMKLIFNHEELDMVHSKIEDYKRWLDLRDGVLHRKFRWSTSNGDVLEIYFKRFINMNVKNISVQEVKVSVIKGSGELYVEAGINGNVLTNGYNHFLKLNPFTAEGKNIAFESVTDNDNTVIEMCSIDCDKIFQWNIERRKNHILYTANKKINENESLCIKKVCSITTDRDLNVNEAPLERGVKLIKEYENKSFENIYCEHRKKWDDKWNLSDIVIEGDEKAQLAVRFSIYHLIRSNVEDDPRVAICAKGYAGEGYYGRYFWDTEIYMLPFYIYTNPKAAKNLLLFRYNTLNGARKNAAYYGYSGARYAWESSVKGEEQCALWQFAHNEVHVTCDIVFALWHYYCASEDYDFMVNHGAEIMIETSRYWSERVDKNSNGNYDLLGVMGPDEYSPFTQNNAFTNRMVKFNLNKTVEFINYIRENKLDDYLRLRDNLNIKVKELELFEEIASKLNIPYDEHRKLYLQSEDFESFADIDINAMWKNRFEPFIKFISQEKLYRSKCIKQADVLAMMTLFSNEFNMEEMQNAYNYYEPITTHDSSLSPSNHGIISCWLGNPEEALRYFNKSAFLDLSLETDGASEGIHIANSGGLWQLIINGFAGVKNSVCEDEIKVSPALPNEWSKLQFCMIWKNKRYRITITHEHYSIDEV